MTAPIDKDKERAREILNRAIMRTKANTMQWKARPTRDFAFEVDLDSGNLEVGSVDDDGAAPFDFRIYRPGPAYGLVYSINTRDEADLRPSIRELWDLANRQASGVDDTLEGLLRDLSD